MVFTLATSERIRIRIHFYEMKKFHGNCLDRRISLRNRKNRTISRNSSQYGMTKESSYKSRSIQNALDFCVSFGFIDSRRPLLYRGASALLIEYQVKGPEKRKIGCYSRLASLLQAPPPIEN